MTGKQVLIALAIFFVGMPVLLCTGCLFIGVVTSATRPRPIAEEPAIVEEPPEKTPEPPKTESPKPEPKKIEPLHRNTFFSANEIGEAYASNEIKADADYKGKRMRVTGTIHSIDKDILGSPFVLLESSKALGVQCLVSDSDPLVSLKKGDVVFLTGVCHGKTIGMIILRECEVVQPED